jgi:hypothetical protein
MFIQHHGSLQQRKVISTVVSHTLSASPTLVNFDKLGKVIPGGAANQTITVTASSGNSWTASVELGTFILINGVSNGTAAGTGNGSFIVDVPKYLSDNRMGSIIIESSAPEEYISIWQGEDPI